MRTNVINASLRSNVPKQAVRVATQYAPARCTTDAAAQLQPIPYAWRTARLASNSCGRNEY